MNYYQGIQNGSENFIKHYGIKGMKWGVRRSSEKRGQSNASKLKEKAKSLGRKTTNDVDSPEAAKAKVLRAKVKANRSTDPLTNAELQHVIQRMNLERQYSSLNQPASSKIIAGGKSFAQSVIKDTTKSLVSKTLKDAISAQLKNQRKS